MASQTSSENNPDLEKKTLTLYNLGLKQILRSEHTIYIVALTSFWSLKVTSLTVQLIPPGDNVTDFTDAEEQRTDSELM